VIDHELRDICERRIPRPALGGVSIEHVLANLASEIDRQRKANREKQKTLKWDPEKVRIVEQTRLLDWIEAELQKLVNLAESDAQVG